MTFMRSGVLVTALVLRSGAERQGILFGGDLPFFTFNSVFIRNSGFLFMLTDKLTWKSKDMSPSFCFMLLTP